MAGVVWIVGVAAAGMVARGQREMGSTSPASSARRAVWWLGGIPIFLGLVALRVSPADADDSAEHFRTVVLPVLERRCFSCHSHAGEISGGLALDSRSGWALGGVSGPAVVPGEPGGSLLVAAVRRDDPRRAMPPDDPLPEEEVATIVAWVAAGAFDPRTGDAVAQAARERRIEEGRQWWSFRPPRAVDAPPVADPEWNRDAVDRFIRARLAAEGIDPAAPAPREVLRRRLSFLLTGLPPVAHASLPPADAPPERIVDALLASPHFGEHFARHWMDVVRYGDTWGYEWDIAAKGSWEYRDWLVRGFNDDVGFDRLVREQIAGDLLADRRRDTVGGVDASLVGPMFFHLGEHRHGSSLDFNGIHQEMVDNKVDAFSKAFLGITVGCARCHDHKLDPILQDDYYALAGMFMSPRWTVRDVSLDDVTGRTLVELARLRGAIQVEVARAWSERIAAMTPGELLERLAVLAAPAQGAATVADPIGARLAGLLAGRSGGDAAVVDAWRAAAAAWRTEEEEARRTRGAFLPLADGGRLPEGWIAEGSGLAHGRVDDGTVRVALEGERVVAEILPAGWHTHALSPKLPGMLRLPLPESFPKPWVSLRVAGGEWAAKLVTPENAFLNEGSGGPVFLDGKAAPQWIAVGVTPPKNGVRRVFTEIATTAFNPNFPPRTGLAQAGGVVLPAGDDGREKRSWFSVTGVVAHDVPAVPPAEPRALAGLFTRPEPEGAGGVWQAVAEWIAGAVRRWAEGGPVGGDAEIVAWAHRSGLLPDDRAALPAAAVLVDRYRELERGLPFPRTVTGMLEEGTPPVDYRLNVRGDVNDEGPPVPRGFLRLFADVHAQPSSPASGRRELADHLASGANPLVARVWVNRVWQWIFGRGIVATPNDFGRLGAPPTHPELLDTLAVEFVRDGWSTKRLVRRLLLTETFRQGGQASAAAAGIDPSNTLLHHHPTRRIGAESVRDALLAVAGRLDPRLGGPPIRPHRTAEDATKRLFSGPLDGDGRRSLYLEASIMAPPAFLVAWNQPPPKIPTGRRDVTAVPAQSLVLLNDPFVVAMADHWAGRLVADGRSDPAARLDAMFHDALDRAPSDAERVAWRAALDGFAAAGSDPLVDRAAWAALAHALFLTKEFLHVR